MLVAERATACDGLSRLSAKIFYHFTRFFSLHHHVQLHARFSLMRPVANAAGGMMMQTEDEECELCVSFSIILAVFIK
ncbi:hypothetical protein H4F64_07055 [Pectobacterium brasiliense]|uniref:hypothetical protein n=1 Tax=Pectobacterium brasiliense TaxID=180957 RepID=UPI001969103F|nr:hypothetical protein [Pectobacterium brasiliense]